jgi:hypothetical protein
MTQALFTLLSEFDACDIGVSLTPDSKIAITNASALTSAHRESVAVHRTELIEYLARNPRSLPDPVWFVSARLDCLTLPRSTVLDARTSRYGSHVCYRLTPRVHFFLLFRALPMPRESQTADVADQLYSFGRYLDRHFLPHQIRIGSTSPRLPIPHEPFTTPSEPWLASDRV